MMWLEIKFHKLIADAVMEVDVHIRKCSNSWIWANQDGCTDISELSEETQKRLKSKLKALEAQWKKITNTGKRCVSPP